MSEYTSIEVNSVQLPHFSYPNRNQCAFTLIELLAVIAIIAILLAVMIPVLTGVQGSARNASNLATLRQMTMALRLYANDHKDGFPFFGVPGSPEEPVQFGKCPIPTGAGGQLTFQWQSRYWVSAATAYLSGWRDLPFETRIDTDGLPVAHCNMTGEEAGMYWSPVVMSHTIFADPLFWTPAGPENPSLVTGTRFRQVKHPPRKGILLSIPLGPERRTRPGPPEKVRIGFADGSVAMKPWLVRSFQPRALPPFMFNPSGPIMTTPNGLEGIDY